MALREGKFSVPSHGTLVESTIRGAISYVSQTFRENDRPNPRKDKYRELGRVLSRQYRAYKNSNPNPKQQKAIPIFAIAEVIKNKSTETQQDTSQLAMRGFFFACRSCRYLMVPEAQKRRTNILRLRCLRFFKYGREIQHSYPYLEYAECNSITFEWKNKDKRNDTVTQLASEHTILCPIRQWAALVKRIRKYPGSRDDTSVSSVQNNHNIEQVTSAEMVAALRDAVSVTV